MSNKVDYLRVALVFIASTFLPLFANRSSNEGESLVTSTGLVDDSWRISLKFGSFYSFSLSLNSHFFCGITSGEDSLDISTRLSELPLFFHHLTSVFGFSIFSFSGFFAFA